MYISPKTHTCMHERSLAHSYTYIQQTYTHTHTSFQYWKVFQLLTLYYVLSHPSSLSCFHDSLLWSACIHSSTHTVSDASVHRSKASRAWLYIWMYLHSSSTVKYEWCRKQKKNEDLVVWLLIRDCTLLIISHGPYCCWYCQTVLWYTILWNIKRHSSFLFVCFFLIEWNSII